MAPFVLGFAVHNAADGFAIGASANLPGTIAGGLGVHIHGPIDPLTGNGLVAIGLDLTDRSTDLVAKGTATDPTLAALILANPEDFYVNVHTTTCTGGAIRGSLG